MRMKTFQADTMQEALARVKDEMGPDAVILKSRKATRKLNGRTVPCFEVTAALEESLFARPEVQARSTAPAPDRAVPGRAQPARPETGQPEAGGAGIRAGRVPEERGTYDWKGSLRRVEEDGRPAGRPEPARREEVRAGAAPQGAVQESLLEQLRAELREVKDKVDMPTRELTALKQELKAMFESANARNPAPAPHASQLNHAALSQGAAQAGAAPGGVADFASPASLPPGLRALHAFLLEMDIDADLAAELAYASAGGRIAGAFAASPAPGGPAPDDMASVAGAMAARIRTTGGVRLRPGKPSVVALVGPTGAGKTTTLCKLAALAKLHQGKRVGILSADSFRMGANEQLELFGRTAGIPVRPLFSAADVGPALKEFAHCDLILVDTAGRSHAHPEAWVEMQSLLRAVRADEIHLVLSTTTRMREMIHQAGMYGSLCRLAPACGVVFTKLDECVSLGCVYNLARRLDAPVSYLCDGQVIPDHISLATPQSVAGKVLSPSKAAEEARQSELAALAARPEPVAR